MVVLQQTLSLYHGDLLPDLYDGWILQRRLTLREMWLDGLAALGRAAEQQRSYQTAYDAYQQLVQADPLRERAYRGLMRALAGRGQLPAAVDTYERLAHRLTRELNVSPTPRTQQLAGHLRRELELQTAVRHQSHQFIPPFVGRVAERARLLARLDKAAGGQGGIAVVLGEAGMGKTRLLQEIAHSADWRGWQMAWGYGDEFSLPHPYAPLTDALSAALPAPRWEQISQLLAPHTLALIAQLLPDRHPSSGQPDMAQAAVLRQQLPLALHQLLDGLQQVAPHLFLLDDVQWADTAVWQLLTELRPHLQNMSVLILICGRIDSLHRQTAVWETLQGWDREGETIIRLPGMAAAALEQLVIRQRPQLTGQQISQLQRSSGGNPLIALNLLDNIPDTVSDIPLSLARLSRQQFTAVSDPAQLALQAAAVVGYRFSYTLWQTILEQVNAADLPQLAGELEQANLIILDEQTYRFTHDTLRATVYRSIPQERRRHLHQSALQAVQQIAPDDTLALLHHAEGAGLPHLTAEYALLAGNQALAAFSYETAVAHFREALDTLPAADKMKRFDALYGRIQALDVLADRAAQQDDLTQLQQIASQLQIPGKQADAHHLSARYFYITGRLDKALQHAQKGLALAQSTGNRRLQADFYHQLGQIVREQGKYGRARAYVQQARRSYRQIGSRYGEAVTTDMLGGLAWAEDKHDEAITNHAAAAQMFHEIGNPFHESMALNNLGSAYWSQGDYALARETLEKSLAISRELGHKRGEGDTLDNLGGIGWVLADYETAVSFYTQALAIRRQINDQWGVSISLGNLGSAHRLMQNWDEALRYFAEALAVNRQMGRKRGEGYNRHGRGLTYLDMGNLAAATADLAAAYNLRLELGEQENQLETLGGLALVCVEAGQLKEAEVHLRQILSQLAAEQRASLRQWLHYVAFRVYQAMEQAKPARQHLSLSLQAMNEIVAHLPPDDQARCRQNFPLNRQILAAQQQLQRQVRVKLARDDAPLGRKLKDADYVTVTWTIYTPEDDAISGTAVHRRHILKRLLAEAQAQHAAPTDDDLARVLGVSRRTILRDMAALRRDGVSLPTRRRESGG